MKNCVDKTSTQPISTYFQVIIDLFNDILKYNNSYIKIINHNKTNAKLLKH